MAIEAVKKVTRSRSFLVAGDICLDVVGVPRPPSVNAGGEQEENWRLTGEVRTHLLPGGAMLLAEFVRSAVHSAQIRNATRVATAGLEEAEDIRRATEDAQKSCAAPSDKVVRGPTVLRPTSLAVPRGTSAELNTNDFLSIAERLTRKDVVHSLLGVKEYPAKPGAKEKVLRVEKCHGFSGPDKGDDPALVVKNAHAGPVDVVVLDDTGNRFRKNDPRNSWPAAIAKPGRKKPLVVYKLHRPLPSTKNSNALWQKISSAHALNSVVVISVEDLRKAGAPISQGLSWERTALDVIWHLLNNDAFTMLRDCPRLVIRLGVEGAVMWHRRKLEPYSPAEETAEKALAKEEGRKFVPRPPWQHQAWLVYDPARIEGSHESSTPGAMVGQGSAFTAAFAAHLATIPAAAFDTLLHGGPDWERQISDASTEVNHHVLDAVEAGLHASRRLLGRGFGTSKSGPRYPGPELFGPAEDDVKLARHAIPILPDTETPDRSYWRLLDSLFQEELALLHLAVTNVATGRKVKPQAMPWRAADRQKIKEMKDADARRKVEEALAASLLESAPRASYGKLSTYDRREIEQYRSLYSLLRDYICNPAPERPLSFAVFGPPGAGKSFGVKEVAASLKGLLGCKEVSTLTFNLSLYQSPEELAAAFHLVRDKALEGSVPLVFFDEFDTALDGKRLGWLRSFLAPMQDGKFLDRGTEHPIGPAIFVFAGGTCGTFNEFLAHAGQTDADFKAVKGPDFLSRLRAKLDIPSINLLTAAEPEKVDGQLIQPAGTYNPYGPTEEFPSAPAIFLRRAGILAFNLKKKCPTIERPDGSLLVDPSVLRALLLMPEFHHGNRSFEAILDMSHLAGADHLTPTLLPAPAQLPLHADAGHFHQLLSVEFPISGEARDLMGRSIHESYLEQRKAGPAPQPGDDSMRKWDDLPEYLKESSRLQADNNVDKLRAVGLWYRKVKPGCVPNAMNLGIFEQKIEQLAIMEHDRFVAERRRLGWAASATTERSSRDDYRMLHNCLFPWAELNEVTRNLDRTPVRNIPHLLAAIGHEVYKP